MSNSEAALQQYTQARAAVADHIKANQALFDVHQNLVMKVIDAENALRDAVAETKEGISNGAHRVTVTPKQNTITDYIELKQLVAKGRITQEEYDKVIHVQERPPQIVVGDVRG